MQVIISLHNYIASNMVVFTFFMLFPCF